MDKKKCPVCTYEAAIVEENGGSGNRQIDCPRCGKYRITHNLYDDISDDKKYQNDQKRKANLSHRIRKMQNSDGFPLPLIDADLFMAISSTNLPSLPEQLNNLILWAGNEKTPGATIQMDSERDISIPGAIDADNLSLIIKTLDKKVLIELDPDIDDDIAFILSFDGWEYYYQLVKGQLDSRKAFMAMKYEDPRLDRLVDEHFRPAVRATGFELTKLEDKKKAGLIDDRLRVEIKTSRFLIADLTHDNNGAYWEAGYAEGLNKPVIYTCEKSKFEEQKTHFDTNHHLTVIWEEEKMDGFVRQLKATIRATLPDVAILVDE